MAEDDNISPLPWNSLDVEFKQLFTPPLQFVAGVLKAGLEENFEEVAVEVVPCPNLTKEPFNLASEGISGNPRILDIGGVPYLVPVAQKKKLYDMKDFPRLTNFGQDEDCLIIGASAAPWTFLKRNAEMMPNLHVKADGSVIQKTHISRTHDADKSYELIPLPEEETKLSLLGNLFLSNGEPGHVLEVKCTRRKGTENFVSCMKKALANAFKTESIGMGGVWVMNKGQLKAHVMPEYASKPLNSDEDVSNWLLFYSMDAPFTCYSVLVSRDPGLDLRTEHTHGLNKKDGQGGHYHHDVTPEEVQYHGYFNLAEWCYRVDRPKVTHLIGRD